MDGTPRFVGIERGQKADLLSILWKVSYDAKPTKHREIPKGSPWKHLLERRKSRQAHIAWAENARFVIFDVREGAHKVGRLLPTLQHVDETGGPRPIN